jgi:hypothetical protein
MAVALAKLKQSIGNMFGARAAPAQEYYRPAAAVASNKGGSGYRAQHGKFPEPHPAAPVNGMYQKKEYYDAPSNPTKTFESMWSSLPKINPRVLLGGNSTQLVDNEIMTGTTGTWDVRGEPEAVKNIQHVRVPNMLISDRQLTAAQQRSANRDFQGPRINQM